MSSRMRRIAVAACVLLAPACVTYDLTEAPPRLTAPVEPSEGEWRITDQVVLITDASRTMVIEQNFAQAKADTVSLAKAMPRRSAPARNPERYDAGFVGFGGYDIENWAIADLAPFQHGGAVEQEAAGLTPLGEIDGYGGETPLHLAIEETAVQLAGRSARTAVVIFSDGRADQPAAALGEATALAGLYPGELCFHTVHYGATEREEQMAGRELLKELAALTPCGSFRTAGDLADAGRFRAFVGDVMFGGGRPLARLECPELTIRGLRYRFNRYSLCDATLEESGFVESVAQSQQRNRENPETMRPDWEVCPQSPVLTYLRTVADDLKQAPAECPAVVVEGHTDYVDSESYNQCLSELRARSVADYFAHVGVDRERLVSVGYGESRPEVGGRDDEARAIDRRVVARFAAEAPAETGMAGPQSLKDCRAQR